MRPGEALYRAMSGGRSPHTEVGTWGDAVGWHLQQSGGNVAGAARSAGVAPSTFRGWMRGALPRSVRAAAIVDGTRVAQRRARMSPARERRLTRPRAMSGLRFDGRYGYSSPGVAFQPSTAGWTGGRQREVHVGAYLDDDAGYELVEAFLSGASLDELEEVFAEQITGARFYEDSFDPNNPDGHAWDVDDLDGWG